MKVPAFMPPLFGERELANFTVYSYPGPASYLMAAFVVVLAVAILLARRQTKRA